MSIAFVSNIERVVIFFEKLNKTKYFFQEEKQKKSITEIHKMTEQVQDQEN